MFPQTPVHDVDALVLFSGPGGSSLGLRNAGVRRTLGIEFDPSYKGKDPVQPAVATARAASLPTHQEDVRTVDPQAAYRKLTGATTIGALLLQASPPCQGLSMAGKGAGRDDLVHLLEALKLIARMSMTETALWVRWYTSKLVERCSDERSPLTFEVVRWIASLNPEYVMLEQVPQALPIWEAIAEVLAGWGYSVWTGNVQAEQYGVPQTRKRALLMASRVSVVEAPVATHSKYHNRDPKKLDEGAEKWVSMAEALGWGMVRRPSYTVTGGGTAAGGAEPFGNGARKGMLSELDAERWVVKTGQNSRQAGGTTKRFERDVEAPAPTVTGQTRSWRVEPMSASTIDGERVEGAVTITHMGDVRSSHGCVRSVDEPAPTMTASMDNGNFQWVGRVLGEAPFDAEASEIVYVNGTHEKAARRPADCPAPTIMFGARLNGVEWQIDRQGVIEEVEGRVNNQSGTEFDLGWPADRPAPVIAGRGLVTMPGANANRFNGSTKSRNDGIRVEVYEAGVLQSFPADYPWQGTKTAQYQCVGNAVPPLLQQVLTSGLLAHRVSERQADSEVA